MWVAGWRPLLYTIHASLVWEPEISVCFVFYKFNYQFFPFLFTSISFNIVFFSKPQEIYQKYFGIAHSLNIQN